MPHCANDATAMGVLDAARFALMLRVRSDVSVVGFDDIPAGRRSASTAAADNTHHLFLGDGWGGG
jgi:DNA-binding LacI/PurR family transcriptional regulator